VSGRPQRILRSKQWLRDLMRLKGHDTVTLAASTGLTKQAIGYLCMDGKAARDSCSARTAELISKALGCPEDTLFYEPLSGETEETEER
jgi:hypothetical protein